MYRIPGGIKGEPYIMKTQELLTYVEELVFKTSMFGYDKDEVDIQLDKICDEIETIVKEKDRQIEALKKGLPVAAAEEKAPSEDAKEEGTAEMPEPKRALDMEEGDNGLRERLETMRQKLQEAEDRARLAEQQVEEAETRAIEAEKKAAAAEGRAAVAETKAAQAAGAGAEAVRPDAEEKPSEEPAAGTPQTRDEAYEQYIRNADLLCQELSSIQGKQDAILQEAQARAAQITKEAEAGAAQLLKDAQAQADEILAGIQDRRAEEQKRYDELMNRKKEILDTLTQMQEGVQELLQKAQQS